MQGLAGAPNQQATARSWADADLLRIDTLQVIFKTAERCNLACTYCYYFFHGDESYKNRNAIFDTKELPGIIEFLLEAIKTHHIKRVSITFHGGEPTLQKARDFETTVSSLKESLSAYVDLLFSIQTNGFHLTEEWLECLEKHQVSVGISLDGPKEYNDVFRKTRLGKGSHDKIEQNILRIQDEVAAGKIKSLSILCVLNYRFSTRVIYDYFANKLGINKLGFLLPDRSWDTGFEEGESAEDYGHLLNELFDTWVDNPKAHVREIDNVLQFFQVMRSEGVAEIFDTRNISSTIANQILVIHSTGEISVDDSLVPTLEWRQTLPTPKAAQTTLSVFLSHAKLRELDIARQSLAPVCQTCVWKKPCGGGSRENRYSKDNGFDNPSVYCAGLKIYYSHVCQFLLANGYPKELMLSKLEVENIEIA